jgi:polysaccharide export outer membrane protein
MNRIGAALIATAAILLASGCTSTGPSPLPSGAAAYQNIPERADSSEMIDAIHVGDRLAIRVFGEPELTSDGYIVDGTGYIQVPLLGDVIATGQTPRSLAKELQRRLANNYIRDASVTVVVAERTLSTYTVEGSVGAPGVYPAGPSTTLLTALAQAKSPLKTAKNDDVLVLRTTNGQKTGGRFSLTEIRRGRAPDPQILAGDTVVVVNSASKTAWQEFLQAVPVFNIFLLVKRN